MMNDIIRHISCSIAENIIKAKPVSGGDINTTYCLHTASKKFFLKTNSKSRFPGMFKAEADGLKLIAGTNCLATPEIILQDDVGDESFLLLQWIETKRTDAQSSRLLGVQLAAMHKNTAMHFGLHNNNYIGSLNQSNNLCNTWADFFMIQRLQPMVKIAIDKGLLTYADDVKFCTLYKSISNLFNEEQPSLIHGDLWGGNYLISSTNKPYLIDPAVTYGHRECDIAMSMLFGGFDDEFYTAYNDVFPLAKDWQQRIDLWNLYPLLVHVNLFGAGYTGQVRRCLAKFV